MQGKQASLPDPGVRRFDEAMDLIKGTNYVEGRKSLYRLLDSFPETSVGPEARRIIGELNMDMLFSQEVQSAAQGLHRSAWGFHAVS